MDYCKSFLDHQQPVSFHKHWMIDPRKVFNDWFGSENKLENSSREEL
jgi:UDP-glucose:O-linked fucose beta-1,3-glucosyltransferase